MALIITVNAMTALNPLGVLIFGSTGSPVRAIDG